MSIEPTTAASIEAIAHRSHAGEVTFGEVVQTLVGAGIESYFADYRANTTTYYSVDGGTHVVTFPGQAAAVAPAFDEQAVRDSIRGAQRDEIRYPEFVARTTAAGCAGYFVWIAGRHVVYYGRKGETWIEQFPPQ